MNTKETLTQIAAEHASDIFIVAGRPLTYKVNGAMKTLNEERIMPDTCKQFITEIYALAGNRNMSNFESTGDDDFSFALPGVSRFRVSIYKQRGSYAAVIRVIAFTLPHPTELLIPEAVTRLANMNRGLVLVTGSAGSGKSTTLACLIDKINSERESHIITLEDPLEFIHNHKKSIVSQREIHTDTGNYLSALRAALRQTPDVILLGEMRDAETISTAMTAAETGHFVLSTLHTIGATNTIERIIDAFPSTQQQQITVQLASVLQAVVSQRLLPTVDGKMAPAFEVMILTPAIRNLIRERRTHQIDNIIFSSTNESMMAMDTSILNLYRKGIIDKRTALSNASNPELMSKKLI